MQAVSLLFTGNSFVEKVQPTEMRSRSISSIGKPGTEALQPYHRATFWCDGRQMLT
jgi:hypothetical protein